MGKITGGGKIRTSKRHNHTRLDTAGRNVCGTRPVTKRLRLSAHFNAVFWTLKCLQQIDCHHKFCLFTITTAGKCSRLTSLCGLYADSPMTTEPMHLLTESADATQTPSRIGPRYTLCWLPTLARKLLARSTIPLPFRLIQNQTETRY